jgi:hypothetical protein
VHPLRQIKRNRAILWQRFVRDNDRTRHVKCAARNKLGPARGARGTPMEISDSRLKYLYEAHRQGTMRAASEFFNVAPSSVSRQIASLERELGLTLTTANASAGTRRWSAAWTTCVACARGTCASPWARAWSTR